jgi:hypothetical protein
MSRGPKARNALQTKLDRLYPRQDARTQLALDYSPEEDGLTLALLPASFFGGLRSLIHSATFPSRAIRLGCLLTDSSACLRNLRGSPSGMAFYGWNPQQDRGLQWQGTNTRKQPNIMTKSKR